jgi:RsiW-degrading membrane proteinase PrsW (M82 family)
MSVITVIAIATLLALVPTLFYALFIWWLDRHEKEPLPLLLVAFLWGAVPAILIAIVLELVVGLRLDQFITSDTGREITSASIVAPVVEELVKGIILIILFVAFRREFDNVLDGVVYGAMVGLGFALVENVLYLTSAAYDDSSTPVVGNMITLWALRAGLFGLNHSMFTAFTGAALGLARSLHGPLRGLVPVLGLVAAMTFHSVHNYLTTTVGINSNGGQNADAGAVLDACVGILVTDWGGLILIVALAIISSIKETQLIRENLADEIAYGRLTTDEYDTLISSRLRWTMRWSVLFSAGVRRWWQLGKFFDLTTELAFRKHRMNDGTQHQQDLNARDIARLRSDIDNLKMAILSG